MGAAGRGLHLPAIASDPALSLVAVCDTVAGDAPAGVARYGSLDGLLASQRPDIVVVATPPSSHHSLCCAALAAGCHVVCEKPFMESLEEARDVVARAAAAGRHVVVNNQYRFMNIHAAARQRIGHADFGDLLFLDARQTFVVTEVTEAGWRGQDPRRTCKEFGTHVLDLCRFFFAEEPRRVFARMPSSGRPGSPELLALMQLEFSRDRVAQVTLDRLVRGPHRYLETRLDGSAATIETRIGGRLEVAAGIEGGRRRPYLRFAAVPGGEAVIHAGGRHRRLAVDPLDIFGRATRSLWAELREALTSGRAPACSGADNINTLRLMLAAYESHELGRPVDLP